MENNCENECCKKWSCMMLQGRFKEKECTIGKELIINKMHLKELQDREVLLKGLSE